MKKWYFIVALLVCSSAFAFQSQLPQQIVCDKAQYCTTSDDGVKQDGWSVSATMGFYIKPGIYKFNVAELSGNPNDNFIKSSEFDYVMADKNGYPYHIQYEACNWFVPANLGAYHGTQHCVSENINDCAVILLTPGKTNNVYK